MSPVATCHPPSPAAAAATEQMTRDLDQARRRGPLQQIQVPPCPVLLTRLQQAMAPAEPDLNAVAQIANGDVAMSATLIRNANGARFAGLQPVYTVGQAMNRLGLDATAALMTGFLTLHSIPVRSPQLQRFWERSTKRAVAMQHLAQQLPGMSAGLAYTFGLFSHVGMPVMMQSIKGYSGTLVEAGARKDRSAIETENANHRTDHAVVGALVARVWCLAPVVMRAIRLHHDLETLRSERGDPEVQTLLATGLVAELLMRRHEGLEADADWQAHGAAALDWLQVGVDEVDQWDDSLRPLLDEA